MINIAHSYDSTKLQYRVYMQHTTELDDSTVYNRLKGRRYIDMSSNQYIHHFKCILDVTASFSPIQKFTASGGQPVTSSLHLISVMQCM